MKVLLLGGGAREHALARALAADPAVSALVCAPGNAGIAALTTCVPASLDRPEDLLALARAERADLTVVGPELPLERGVADVFASAGYPLLGPSQAAARLETSKAFAKEVMVRAGVPTASHRVCASLNEAEQVIASGALGTALVVKADGLAAGKGVVVCDDRRAAEEAAAAMLRDRVHGPAGDRVVIEQRLHGRELSFFALCDGEHAVALGGAQDHKRLKDEDRGPNTGGMGAFSPSPLLTAQLQQDIEQRVVEPMLTAMADAGTPFVGILYCGLMLTAAGPQVIEFNVRFGDPEAQVLLPRLDEPLAPLLWAAAHRQLAPQPAKLRDIVAVGVVLAAEGYPEKPRTGDRVDGLDAVARDCPKVTVCAAGVAERGGQWLTAGGRVLTVVGEGASHAEAARRAYEAVERIRFPGMQFRRDIGTGIRD